MRFIHSDWKFYTVMFLFVCLLGFAFWQGYKEDRRKLTAPCTEFLNKTLDNVPARCLKELSH